MTRDTSRMKRRNFLALAGGAVLTVATLNPEAAEAQKLRTPSPIADFTLTDQDGKTVTKKDLEGSAVIFAFQFTNCTAMCPRTTGILKKLQESLKDTPNIKIISVTIDPDRDTHAVIKQYMKDNKIKDNLNNAVKNNPTWQFLTGSKDEIRKIYQSCFVGAKDPIGGKLGHSPNFMLLDKEGRITQARNIFEKDESLGAFVEDVKAQASKGRSL